MVQEYVTNQGNAWQVTVEELGRFFDRVLGSPAPPLDGDPLAAALSERALQLPPLLEAVGAYLPLADVLGRRTGELHATLAEARPGETAFAPEPLDAGALAALLAAMKDDARGHLDLLESSIPRLDARQAAHAREVISRRDQLLDQFDAGRVHDAGRAIRCHGDYHLGQVLVTEGDVVILDFEGEPKRPLSERRRKTSPLRDVAGMLRSFSYAACTALTAATQARPEDAERLQPWAGLWEATVSAAFLRAYRSAAADADVLPARRADLEALLRVFTLEKALYEVAYELNSRPEWVHIPLGAVLNEAKTQLK
jgi:maltose alpha-D-glucosyltransferase/alpha-amylase